MNFIIGLRISIAISVVMTSYFPALTMENSIISRYDSKQDQAALMTFLEESGAQNAESLFEALNSNQTQGFLYRERKESKEKKARPATYPIIGLITYTVGLSPLSAKEKRHIVGSVGKIVIDERYNFSFVASVLLKNAIAEMRLRDNVTKLQAFCPDWDETRQEFFEKFGCIITTHYPDDHKIYTLNLSKKLSSKQGCISPTCTLS